MGGGEENSRTPFLQGHKSYIKFTFQTKYPLSALFGTLNSH